MERFDIRGGPPGARNAVAGSTRWPVEKGATVLKRILLLIGACVVAPVALFAFLVSILALPFLLAGWLLVKLVQRRRFSLAGIRVSDKRLTNLGMPRRLPLGPLTLAILMCATALQIKLVGFSWSVDRWLGAAMLAVAALWWLQRRVGAWRLNRFRRSGGLGIARHDLYRLFEIERADGPEERRMLIVRELNRLTREAQRPDPTDRSSWPSIPELTSIRDQVRFLRSSLVDLIADTSPESGHADDRASRRVLMSDVDALEKYLNQFVRISRIGHDDLELIRVLVRDQRRLREIQDEILDQLQRSVVSTAG